MKKMTGEEFYELIRKDPSWCLNIKEPLEITTYVELIYTNITHLSPLLTFKGKNNGNLQWVADFRQCKFLKVATGIYDGFVNFSGAGITTIKDLIIKKSDATGEKARFINCPITYIPIEYRKEGFLFNDEIIKNSILRDKTISKIKSEANNIEI